VPLRRRFDEVKLVIIDIDRKASGDSQGFEVSVPGFLASAFHAFARRWRV